MSLNLFYPEPEILPPTGVMLLGAALPESYGLPQYSKEQIKRGIKRDYRFGKSDVRTVASRLNACRRHGIPSTEVNNEKDVSLVAIDVARRGFETYPLNEYSPEAQRRIESGRQSIDESERGREVKVKFLNFDGNLDNPLICATARRESKLRPKCGKFMERLMGVMQYYEATDETPEISFRAGIERLFELNGDVSLWRSESQAQRTPSKLFRVCVTDFSGTTFIINPPHWIRRLEEGGKRVRSLQEDLENEISSRMRRIIDESKEGYVEITRSENFPSRKDRANSIVLMDYETFAINEVRVNTRRDYVEGKIGGEDIAHHHYKSRSRDNVIRYFKTQKNPVFREIGENLIALNGVKTIEDLFK